MLTQHRRFHNREPGGRRPGRASRGVHAFLDGEEVWDEEKADREFYEDSLTPALEAFQDDVAGDLAAQLAGMRIGETAELRCENGTFEIVRDR